MKKLLTIIIIMSTFLNLFAQSHYSTQAHQDKINAISDVTEKNSSEKAFFTAGEDGFLIKWTEDGQGEHYQISDVGIKLIAVSPNGNLIAVYESDGGSVNKVSVWDWKTLTRKYQKKFTDSITSLSFSAKGTYLIIGTATVDGAIFIKTQSWTIADKIKTNTNIVNFIQTSDSEKTVVFYSPSGKLSYFNLENGELKQKFEIVQGLSQPLLFNQNKFFAGVKDNQIFIINAFKGTSVASIPAENPIILSKNSDNNLYFLEYDGKNTYTLKMLENLDNQTVSNPRIIKTLKGPKGDSSITTGLKTNNEITLGSRSGEVYLIENEASTSTEYMHPITENSYSKIFDMCSETEDFYFLTEKSIFKSSYDNGVVSKLSDTHGENKIAAYKDNNIILWSNTSKTPVSLLDLDKHTSVELFTPKNNIQSLKICSLEANDYIVEIESNSSVNVYDMNKKTLTEIYSGTGIQDAIITNNNNVYIAKAASSNPQVPLIKVNIETLETVPLALKGNVSYGLSTDGKIIYGINLISDSKETSTYVFSYNTASNQFTNILKFSEEDSGAFTYLYKNNLFTNIGKNKVYCYNLGTKKRFSYNRSASIPENICQNQNRVVILNNNGSISWAGDSNAALLADWYLTTDEQWFEF